MAFPRAGPPWQVARNWAVDRYGDGSTSAPGWHQGSFWTTVNTCGRPGHDPMGTTRPTCTDPNLARVDRAVNGPEWFAVR